MKKIIILFIILTFIFTVFAGCAEKPNSGPDGEQYTKITVVLDWTPNTNHTGLYVAQEKGYYKDAGLDVQIIQPPEDGALPLLAAGSAQFAVSFQEDIATALDAENPLPVIAVSSLLQHNTSGLISLKSKNINTPKDLEGKKYATWDMPLEKAILKDIITKDGGDYNKLQMIPSTVDDVIAALNTDIDVVWIYYGWEGIATEVNGLDTNFMEFRDLDPVFDYYTPLLAANKDFANKNPDITKKFLQATKKGYEYAIENPEDAVKILTDKVPEIDQEIAEKSQIYLKNQYVADGNQWGYIDGERWKTFYDWLYENGITSRDLGSEGFTMDYLTE
ncbi:MAG: ABC transporter substrate-binding protein [Clostridiales bacterium]|jgi:ABC-type nitrate/sulfonate/bicarbonate transport system substrate-binding protein|nr:ABC transporter substrate-binding protein [Clostridiales bacterium]